MTVMRIIAECPGCYFDLRFLLRVIWLLLFAFFCSPIKNARSDELDTPFVAGFPLPSPNAPLAQKTLRLLDDADRSWTFSKPVETFEITPDGKRIIAACGYRRFRKDRLFGSIGVPREHESSLEVRDVETGKLIRCLHEGQFHAGMVRISPDGKYFAAVSCSGAWELAPINGVPVRNAEIKDRLASELRGTSKIKIWSVSTFEPVWEIRWGIHDGHKRDIRPRLFIAPQTPWAPAPEDRIGRQHQVAHLKLDFAWSPDSSACVFWSQSGTVTVLNMTSGSQISLLNDHSRIPIAAHFSTDSKTIITLDSTGMVSKWDRDSGVLRSETPNAWKQLGFEMNHRMRDTYAIDPATILLENFERRSLCLINLEDCRVITRIPLSLPERYAYDTVYAINHDSSRLTFINGGHLFVHGVSDGHLQRSSELDSRSGHIARFLEDSIIINQ